MQSRQNNKKAEIPITQEEIFSTLTLPSEFLNFLHTNKALQELRQQFLVATVAVRIINLITSNSQMFANLKSNDTAFDTLLQFHSQHSSQQLIDCIAQLKVWEWHNPGQQLQMATKLEVYSMVKVLAQRHEIFLAESNRTSQQGMFASRPQDNNAPYTQHTTAPHPSPHFKK